jgi:hypothetical protein
MDSIFDLWPFASKRAFVPDNDLGFGCIMSTCDLFDGVRNATQQLLRSFEGPLRNPAFCAATFGLI